jgi:hypothetical protein
MNRPIRFRVYDKMFGNYITGGDGMTGVDSAKCQTCRRGARRHGGLFCKRRGSGRRAVAVPVNKVSLGWCAVHYELAGYQQKRLQRDEEPPQTLRTGYGWGKGKRRSRRS